MRLCIIFALFFMIVAGGTAWSATQWKQYYKENAYKEPLQEVILAAKSFENKKGLIAIDLGVGAGNEAVHLVKKGWRVIAIDPQPLSKRVILGRKDLTVEQRERLYFITKRYGDVAWKGLPKVDLVIASHAFLVLEQDRYKEAWAEIQSRIKVGGKFVGNFFGRKQGDFQATTREKMLLLTGTEIEELFKGYKFELFRERFETYKMPKSGQLVDFHNYTIIAQKVRIRAKL